MSAPDPQVVLWSVRPPDPMHVATKFGKTLLCDSANRSGVAGSAVSGVIQKHSAATGEFWAVLRSEAPADLAVLKNKLLKREYAVVEMPREAVPGSLLDLLERKPVEVLPSADDVHSRGSSGARDRGEIPLTDDDQGRLTVAEAFDDAALQATLGAKEIRRIQAALEKSQAETKAVRENAEKAAKEDREKFDRERAAMALLAKEEREKVDREREKGDRERAAQALAAKEEREEVDRERAAQALAAQEEREKVDRERAEYMVALREAEVRAARAEAMLSVRRCTIV